MPPETDEQEMRLAITYLVARGWRVLDSRTEGTTQILIANRQTNRPEAPAPRGAPQRRLA